MKNMPMTSDPDMDRIFALYFSYNLFFTMMEDEDSVDYLSFDYLNDYLNDYLKSPKTTTVLEDGNVAYSNNQLSEENVKIIRIQKGEYVPNQDIHQLLCAIGVDPNKNEYFEMDIYYCFKENTMSAIRYFITSSMFERFLDLINSQQSAKEPPMEFNESFYREKIVPIYNLLIDKLVNEYYNINFPIDLI